MTIKKALVMLVVTALGLGCLIFFPKNPDKSAKDAAKLEILPDVSVEDVQELSVISAEASFSIKRAESSTKDGNWLLKKPENARVEEESIAQVLSLLCSLKIEREIQEHERLDSEEDYGLLPPEMLIRLKGAFGVRVLSLGKIEPLSGARYLQLEKEPKIFLVKDIFSHLAKTPEELREKMPIHFDYDRVLQVAAVKPQEAPLFVYRERQKDSPWFVRLGKSEQIQADTKAVLQSIRGLAELSAARYVDDPGANLALYGLDRPLLIVRLALLRGSRDSNHADPLLDEMIIQIGRGISLREDDSGVSLGGLRAGYYFKIAGEPWIYEAKTPTFRNLLQGPEFFRSRNLFVEVDKSLVRSLELSRSKGRLELRLLDETKAESRHGRLWLDELFSLQALWFFGESESKAPKDALSDSSAELVARGDDGGIIFRLNFEQWDPSAAPPASRQPDQRYCSIAASSGRIWYAVSEAERLDALISGFSKLSSGIGSSS